MYDFKIQALMHRLILLGMIISILSCSSQPMEESPTIEESQTEYRRPGARSSEFIDGPYLIYENEMINVLRSSEVDSQMVLSMSRFKAAELSDISVYKAGYLPRSFNVQIKNEIKSPPTVYPDSDSIFAVSDIEGNINTLINLLHQHGVIDEHLHWSFGSGHFVFAGDVFDRGNHVTEMLWFLYGLEDQAAENNGRVHMLLGNHEAMNLRGDLRYVEPKYSTFSDLASEKYGVDYSMLYGLNSELGRWLRSKNVVEKIGDKLFVHAGISRALIESGYTLEKINQLARVTVATPKEAFTEGDKLIWGKKGPFWYRGYFDVEEETWGSMASQVDVELALEHFGANHIIVGHTHVEKPEFRYGGKICAIDVVPPADHLVYVPPLQAYGVLIQRKTFFIADENGQVVEMVD